MKKITIAIAAIGTFSGAANAQSNVTIYGIVDAALTFNSKVAMPTASAPRATARKQTEDSGVMQASRLGFKGAEDLGGGLTAIFQLENGFGVDTGAAASNGNAVAGGLLFGRQSWLGLSGAFGKLTVGRQIDILGTFAPYTAVADFGSTSHSIRGGFDADRVGAERTNNSVLYVTPNLRGFTFSVLAGLGEQAGSSSAGRAFSIGGTYANGPFGMGVGYYQSKLGSTSSDANNAVLAGCASTAGAAGDTCAKISFVGANYLIGAVKIYGAWSQVKQPLAKPGALVAPLSTSFLPVGTQFVLGGANNEKTDIFQIGGKYAMTGQLSLIASILNVRARFIGAQHGAMNEVNLGADYFLSKRTDLYALYGNLRTADMYSPGLTGGAPGADNTQNIVRMGVRHSF